MDYGKHQAPQGYEPVEGILTTLIRIPVRIVVLVLVLPVRMVWDALTALWHAADRILLRPLGRGLAALLGALGRGLEWLFDTLVLAPLTWLYTGVLTPLGKAAARLAVALFVWPWIVLWRYGAVPVARYGIAVPAGWLYAAVLTPLGHGLRWIGATLLVPAGRALGTGAGWLLTALFVWPVAGLWRYLIVPVVRYGVVVPAGWLYAAVLTPVGRGAAWIAGRVWQGTAWSLGLLWRGVSWTGGLLWRGVEAAGRGLWFAAARLVMTLLVAPASWTYRRILVPVGREVADAAEVAWRIAGYLSRAVGRAVAWLAWHLIGAPVSWAYRTVCTPVGHFVRDALLAPARRAAVEAGRAARTALAAARETVRQARRDAWRALVGGTGPARAGEPAGVPARTLGSTTTVPSAAQASETSLLGEKFVKQG